MPFAYYARLSKRQQAIYDRSDGVVQIRLPEPAALRPRVQELAGVLALEDRARIEDVAQHLVDGLSRELRVVPVRVEVLTVRPHAHWGELHGLYTEGRGGRRPKITVWMRTARQKRVVAFRTFFRTILHEVCHHLDYRLLRLADSFHTEGFYKRESSLFHQLVEGDEARGTAASALSDSDSLPRARHSARAPRADTTRSGLS